MPSADPESPGLHRRRTSDAIRPISPGSRPAKQGGAGRAAYGRGLLTELSARLTAEFGRGFDASNLRYLRQFYQAFPNGDALRHELSWTRYRLLLRVEDAAVRAWYMNEAAGQNWNTCALERQIGTLYFDTPKLMIELAEGNLLDAPADALVNTVNTEGVMGKGIALQFRKKFPEMLTEYRAVCESGDLRPGRMHVWERGEMFQPRYVINFPTKRHWRGKSRMADIEAGLVALADEIRRLGIRSVAVPPLGCGNGGLEWSEVFPRIKASLERLEGVRVLVYPPHGAPPAAEIVHRTERPAMNPSRAIVLKIWQQYFALGYQLTLLEVHKLLYFLQEAGEPLRLRFAKDTYGPYADNLRHLLHRFEGHFTLGFADGRNRPDIEIELQPRAVEEAEAFLQANAETSQVSRQRLERVTALVEGYESPYGLELLATVHWVVMHENGSNEEKTVSAVHGWNPRKRKLMSREHIVLARGRLSDRGWI